MTDRFDNTGRSSSPLASSVSRPYRRMYRFSKSRLPVLLPLLLLAAGCHHRTVDRADCCRIATHGAADATKWLAATDCQGGVRTNLDAAAVVNPAVRGNIDSLSSGEPLNIGLEDCCCVAALNSPVANLIDNERKAVCCEAGLVQCFDRFLSGQALEQRNKSAANAGELFLRLVEVNLQRALLDESFAKIEELEQAARIADNNGLATEGADAELQAQSIELRKKRLEVNQSQAELSVKLNLILGIDSCNPRSIQPCFELAPEQPDMDLDQLVILALCQRPGLSAMRNTGCGCDDSECLALISKIEPRLGNNLTSKTGLCQLFPGLDKTSGSSDCIRRQQIAELRANREELVRQEVIDAVIQIEGSFQRLGLDNEDLARLERRDRTIDASSQLDAQTAYLDSIENWVQRQQAQSRRITTAIEFEIGKVRLREATGQWISQCGLCSTKYCGCTACNGK